MPQLSHPQIAKLIDEFMSTKIVKNEGNGGPITVHRPFKGGADPAVAGQETITRREYETRIVTAIAIIIAESNGWTNARNYPRNECPGADMARGIACNNEPGRGVDRGLWQWNSKAWPQISDSQADHPQTATALAWLYSDGFGDFNKSGHGKSKGVDQNSAQWEQAKQAYLDRFGEAVPEIGVGPIAVEDPTEDILGGIDAVGEFFRRLWDLVAKAWDFLTSADTWRRVGLGAAAVAIGALAIGLVFGDAFRDVKRVAATPVEEPSALDVPNNEAAEETSE